MRVSIDRDSYWNQIPIGKKNAVDYKILCKMWDASERTVRMILHELSCYDNGDRYILIRSSKGKGFYRTDDTEEIRRFKQECLNKGRSIFAPVKKCNRVLAVKDGQTDGQMMLDFDFLYD